MKDEIYKREIEREEYVPFEAGDERLADLISEMTEAEKNIEWFEKQIKPLKDSQKEQQKISDAAKEAITKGKPVKCVIEETFNFTKGKVSCLNTETMKSYTRDITEEDQQLDCFDKVVDEESETEPEEVKEPKEDNFEEPLPLGKAKIAYLSELAKKYDVKEQRQFIVDDFCIKYSEENIIDPENIKEVSWLLNQIPKVDNITEIPKDEVEEDVCGECQFGEDPLQCDKSCKVDNKCEMKVEVDNG